MNKQGYVYLIYDYYNTFYKIGVSNKSPEKRIKELQTGNPSELRIVKTYKTPYPFKLETMLHNHLKQFKVLNEWFCLPNEYIDGFEDLCRKYETVAESLENNPFFNKQKYSGEIY